MSPERWFAPSGAKFALLLLSFLIFSLEFFTAFGSFDRVVTLFLGPLSVAAVLVQFRLNSKSIPPELWLYLVFVMWSLAGLPVVFSLAAFWRYWRRLLELFVLASCVAVAVRKTGRLDVLLWGFLVAGLTIGVYGYATGELQRSLNPNLLERANVIYANPNGMAYVCVSALIAVLYLWDLVPGKAMRVALVVAASLLEFAIIASASRGAFVTSIILFALWAWFSRRSQLLRSPIKLVGVLVLAAVLYSVTQFVMSSTFLGTRFQRTTGARSFGQVGQREVRAGLIEEGWRIARQHPIGGIGLNQMVYHTRERLGGHSDLAEIPATTGFPGLFLYVVFLAAVWRKTRLAQKATEGAGYSAAWDVQFPRLLMTLTLAVVPFKMTFYDLDSVTLIAASIGYSGFLLDRARLASRRAQVHQATGSAARLKSGVPIASLRRT